jgi:hypothetical protein
MTIVISPQDDNRLNQAPIERPLYFDEFFDWLRSSSGKKRVIWYEGFLSVDRNASNKKSDDEKYRADALNDYARFVVSCHDRGDVILTQQKIEKSNYRYYAEKARTR